MCMNSFMIKKNLRRNAFPFDWNCYSFEMVYEAYISNFYENWRRKPPHFSVGMNSTSGTHSGAFYRNVSIFYQ